MNTKYKYHDGNRNKDYTRSRKGADCVVRSISIILNQSYKTTLKDLCDYSVKYGAIPNDEWLYEKYLLSKGFEKQSPPKINGKKIQLKNLQFEGRCVLLTRNHLTAVINNTVYDTWDCRQSNCNSFYTLGEWKDYYALSSIFSI
tara:strand:- start:42 stop:473 length:432 start_codon:yes stop_codon:yes gene_type:complete